MFLFEKSLIGVYCNRAYNLGKRFSNWVLRRLGAPRDFARGAAKPCESCCICCCQVHHVSRNFIMGKYCLKELLVNRLLNHKSQCNTLCNDCPFNFINLCKVKFGGNFCPPLRRSCLCRIFRWLIAIISRISLRCR